MSSSRNKLFIINFIFLAILIIASPLIIMSPMMFDAPGSKNSIIIKTVFYTLFFYTPIFLVSSIGSFILYKKNKKKLAVLWSLLPILNIIIFGIGSILMFSI